MTKETAIDKAFKLFHEKKHDKAHKAFDKLLKDEKIPAWFKLKIQQYQRISDSRMAKKEKRPSPAMRDVFFYMNLKQYGEAEALLKKIELADSDKDYLMAEIKIEQNQENQSATFLKKAIEEDPHNLGYALNSPAFSPYLNKEQFQFLRKEKH